MSQVTLRPASLPEGGTAVLGVVACVLVLGVLLAPAPHAAGFHATWLALLLALFVLRVLGQIIVILRAPRWLPPNREWYSGLLPYPVLLPIQIGFISAMSRMTMDVARGGVGWAVPRPALGAVLLALSFVYAGGMLLRFVVWRRRPPQARRAWVPIVFHVVLAAFLGVFALFIRG